MKQQEPEGYICKKSARLCWGRGMLRHTRGRQELASWPTWEDKEPSEERNGGKDLQFATTTPLDPVTPFRRQSRACAVVRMNQFWRWNSFRTLSPKGSSKQRHIPANPCKTGRPEAQDWLAAEDWGLEAGTRCTKGREWVSMTEQGQVGIRSRASFPKGSRAHGEPHVSARE
jgi:hypothetical protein